ncbi:MAG: DUF3459 domain-containing protein [Candidatus Binatia bacterium]
MRLLQNVWTNNCERSKLDWHESKVSPHAGFVDWYRRLIRLRRQIPTLCDGLLDQVKIDFDECAKWFVMRRGPVAVACNLAASRQRVPIGSSSKDTRLIMASELEIQLSGGEIELPQDAVAVVLIGDHDAPWAGT